MRKPATMLWAGIAAALLVTEGAGAEEMQEIEVHRASMPAPAHCIPGISAAFGATCFWREADSGIVLLSVDEYDVSPGSSGLPADVLTGFNDMPSPEFVVGALDLFQRGWEALLRKAPEHESLHISDLPETAFPDGALGCRRYDWSEIGQTGNRFLGRGVFCISAIPGSGTLHYVAAALGGERAGDLDKEGTATFLARADALLAGLRIDDAAAVSIAPPPGCGLTAREGEQSCVWQRDGTSTLIVLSGFGLRPHHLVGDPEALRAALLDDPAGTFARFFAVNEEVYRAGQPPGHVVETLSQAPLPPDRLPAGLQACHRTEIGIAAGDAAAVTQITYACGGYDPDLNIVFNAWLEIEEERAPGTPMTEGLERLAEEVFGSLRMR